MWRFKLRIVHIPLIDLEEPPQPLDGKLGLEYKTA